MSYCRAGARETHTRAVAVVVLDAAASTHARTHGNGNFRAARQLAQTAEAVASMNV